MVNSMKPLRRRAGDTFLCVLGSVLFSVLLAGEASATDCRLSLSQPFVDYGLLRGSEHSSSQAVAVGKRSVRLNVVCPESTVIALRFQGTPAEGHGFMFGRQGYFNLSLQHPLLDGKPVELALLHDRSDRGGQLRPGQSLVVLAGGLPASGRRFSAHVQVDTWLSRAATAVRDKTMLEGNGRFELVPAG